MRKVIIQGFLVVCLLLVGSVYAEALAPSQLECSWCGSQCLPTSMMRLCPEVGTPPVGKSCSYVNGACTIKSTTSVTPTKKVTPTGTVAPSRVPTLTLTGTLTPTKVPTPGVKCGWCGLFCGPVVNARACAEVLPPKGVNCVEKNGMCVKEPVTLTKTPTVSVTPTCVPRPACLDLPKPCLIQIRPEYCPKANQGDANSDGKVDLVDFSIWKGEYANGVAGKKADFDKDGKVDLVDFSIWKVSYLAVK